MSRSRPTRPLIRYSLCPLRYRRRLTTTSPGFVTISGLLSFFFRLPLKESPFSSDWLASTGASVFSADSVPGSCVTGPNAGPPSAFSAKFGALCDSALSVSSFSAPSSTNRAASASSGSSSVIVTSASPIGGRFVVPLKMQSAMRSARRLLWLCSPSTQEIASTTLDFPQPFGPTMHVVPEPLNVTTVRSQNDLNPVISTFRSLSKVSLCSLFYRLPPLVRALRHIIPAKPVVHLG